MARARLLKPGFFANDRLAEIPAHGRLLFAGLWTLADREGRLPDRPRWIKGAIFPYENQPIDKLLALLNEAGFIQRYVADGDSFIQIVNFLKHQTPHVKEQASTIPAPDKPSASTAFSGTSPSVSIAETVTDPVAVAETEDARAPDCPFSLAYVKHWQEEHAHNRPSPARHGEIVALEKEHGSDRCFQAATERGWGKPADYYRQWLLDPNNTKEARNGRAKTLVGASGRGSRGTVTSAELDDLERYARGEID